MKQHQEQAEHINILTHQVETGDGELNRVNIDFNREMNTLVKALQKYKEKPNFWKKKWISESSLLHRAMNYPSA